MSDGWDKEGYGQSLSVSVILHPFFDAGAASDRTQPEEQSQPVTSSLLAVSFPVLPVSVPFSVSFSVSYPLSLSLPA